MFEGHVAHLRRRQMVNDVLEALTRAGVESGAILTGKEIFKQRKSGLHMTKTVPTPHTRVLVLDVPMENRLLTLGLVADRVFEVTPFRHEQIEAAPDIGVRWRSDYIAGVVRRENGFVVIIDLARLLSREDASVLQSAA